MKKYVFCFHVIAFLATVFVVLFDIYVVEPGKPLTMKKFGGRGRYLTIWNVQLQLVYFGFCVVSDVLDFSPSKRRFISTVFASLVFPLAMFVGITFWGLYVINRELVFPKILDQFVPGWVNHFFHTNIVMYAVLELLLVRHEFPTKRLGLTISSIFSVIYLAWVHIVYYVSGSWPYPILNLLPTAYRYMFFLGVLVLVYFIYLTSDVLNQWRVAIRSKTAKSC